MKHDARALVGGAAPRSAKEHVVLALLNAQWRGGSTLAEQLLFTTTIQEPFRGRGGPIRFSETASRPATYATRRRERRPSSARAGTRPRRQSAR